MAIKKCPKCKCNNPATFNQCFKCKADLNQPEPTPEIIISEEPNYTQYRCTYCNSQVGKADKFCKNCGAQFSDNTEQPSQNLSSVPNKNQSTANSCAISVAVFILLFWLFSGCTMN